MKSSIGYIAWRRRQDSNLHVLAGDRFSRPWQYQLCLLLHIGVTGGTRIHDNQSHNLVFYRLNYGHMVRTIGFEPMTPWL